MKNQTFGLLLKAALSSIAWCENKDAPVVEYDLSTEIGVAASTIQYYKAGNVPSNRRYIEILARAAVKRGHMDRVWLEKFLEVAGYLNPNTLVNELCPAATNMLTHVERICQNLPAPAYREYVMRTESYNDVIEGLRLRSAVVMIVSLGGMGKTTLAREIADRCLKGLGGAPQFDAAVWVSDKDRSGTTTLNLVLDEIARTMDCRVFTQLGYESKLYEIEQLLRQRRILLVIDNYDTVTDNELSTWLQRLPEPSKALLTSREHRQELRGCWSVELHGMTDTEAWAFVRLHLRVLRIEKLASDLSEVEPLITITGGNPMAIETILGYFKHSHQTLQQVVDDFYAAKGDLFNNIFSRCWKLLNQTTLSVLLVMPLFQNNVSRDGLAKVADVEGIELERALGQLTDFSLLTVERLNLGTEARYALHPLVRVYIEVRLAERPQFEAEARNRWVHWYVQLASDVGYCWKDLTRLRLLDPEKETVYSVLRWVWHNERYELALRLAKDIGYFLYQRGFWEENMVSEIMHVEAARRLSDIGEEILALSYIIRLLINQGQISMAEAYLPRMYELEQFVQPSDRTLFRFYDSIALYWMASGNLEAAQRAWEKSLNCVDREYMHEAITNRMGLATCLHKKGQTDEALHLLSECLNEAMSSQWHRQVVACQIRLIPIYLDQGKLEDAEKALVECRTHAYQFEDQGHAAEIERCYARLHLLRGDIVAADTSLTKAIDLCKRLGKVTHFAELQAELVHLNDRSIGEN